MIKPKGINHIGIAVRSIEGHRAFYERTLGARFDGIEEVPSQHVRVASFVVGSPGHETRLELIEATAPEAAVAAFVEQRGEGLHHIAYDVDDLDKQLPALKAEGVRLADEAPREGVPPDTHRLPAPEEHRRRPHGAVRDARRPEETRILT